jgi:hypothetical protein
MACQVEGARFLGNFHIEDAVGGECEGGGEVSGEGDHLDIKPGQGREDVQQLVGFAAVT